MQKVLRAGAHANLEIFDLSRRHVFQGFSSAVVKPTLALKVCLNHTSPGAAEFGAFSVRINDVIDEAQRRQRRAVFVYGIEAAANHRVHVEVRVAAENFDGPLYDCFSLLVVRCGW